MLVNYFVGKETEPQEKELETALASTYPLFKDIVKYFVDTHRDFRPEWKQYSKKTGCNLNCLMGKEISCLSLLLTDIL